MMKIIPLLFSPKGNVPRFEFLMGHILSLVIPMCLVFIPSIIPQFSSSLSAFTESPLELQALFQDSHTFLALLLYGAGIGIFYYCIICLGCKRLRDIGLSAWRYLFLIIPAAGQLLLVIFQDGGITSEWMFIFKCISYLSILYLLLFLYPSKKWLASWATCHNCYIVLVMVIKGRISPWKNSRFTRYAYTPRMI